MQGSIDMTSPLVIYHGNCADGFGAAWATRRGLSAADENCEFYPGTYQKSPPDPQGRVVIFVDFCYKRSVMLELAKKAEAILVLDHHKSAVEDMVADGCYIIDMAGYLGALTWERFLDNVAIDRVEGGPRIYTIFDQERSGAGLAWDFFHPYTTRPMLIDHIEDRDLWRFKLNGTREISANLFSYPYDFAVWDTLFSIPAEELIAQGEAIERKHHKDVAELLATMTRTLVIGGHAVPAANLPYVYSSDAGHAMAKGHPFAACYWDVVDGRVFSLRSTDEGLDVSKIAVEYGGGGHRNAAGFKVDFAQASLIELRSIQAPS
jgi:uncharacterized protein